MTELAIMQDADREDDDVVVADVDESFIPLSDPDITLAEIEAVDAIMRSPRLSLGAGGGGLRGGLRGLCRAQIRDCGSERHAWAAVRAEGLRDRPGTGGHRVVLFVPGDGRTPSASPARGRYSPTSTTGPERWSPEKAEARITANTRAIVACNNNGHPAQWSELRAVAKKHGLVLIEDSTEAIGSRYKGALVGTFGDVAVFDFSQPSALTCGEGGMVVTDDIDVAVAMRRHRAHRLEERASVVVSATPPYQAAMSNIAAALGLAQLRRLDEILERRRLTEHLYYKHVQSFEGIKPPYVGPDVTEVNWFLYVVHLGTRFTRSSRDAIVEDLRVEQVEAAAYCNPLHLQRHYFERGYRRGDYFVTEKVADRAVALPFHTHLTEDQISFIVETMKDASINVGAGAAIY